MLTCMVPACGRWSFLQVSSPKLSCEGAPLEAFQILKEWESPSCRVCTYFDWPQIWGKCNREFADATSREGQAWMIAVTSCRP